MNIVLISAIIVLFNLFTSQQTQAEWFRGNIHTHTLNSDGDSAPDDVVRWYRQNRYNFVVVTDHNYHTDVTGLNATFAAPGKFLVIPGNEVSVSAEGKPVHILAIYPKAPVKSAYTETTVRDALSRNMEAVLAARALPVICHPNFMWALTFDDLTATKGWHLLEIQNRHPIVNNRGGGDRPDTESLWDNLLSRGMRVYGVADDDTHTLRTISSGYANPGQGWIVVRADSLSAEAVTGAMAAGDFYFSTGIELADVRSDKSELAVTIRQSKESSVRYTVDYIGMGGKVLSTVSGLISSYSLKSGDSYVRVRITDSNGLQAWTQPLFADK